VKEKLEKIKEVALIILVWLAALVVAGLVLLKIRSFL
jgi:hypothetical protein